MSRVAAVDIGSNSTRLLIASGDEELARASIVTGLGEGVDATGRLDLGPWQQVFYCEFDGGRPKRMVIKVIGE